MHLADPLRQPQRFLHQADALMRESVTHPGRVDGFGQLEASLDASFDQVLAELARPPRQEPVHHTTVAEPHALLMSNGPTGMEVAPYQGILNPAAAGPVLASGPMLSSGAYPMAALTGIPSASFALPAPTPVAAVPSAPIRESRSLGAELEPLIAEMSTKFSVPDWLVRNVIRQESGGNANATSPVGAQGLMQLMPGTARDLGVQDAYDPRQNMEGGVKYLRQMLDLFDGDERKAVAAYNAGPGNVQRYGGVPPFAETQAYVKAIIG